MNKIFLIFFSIFAIVSQIFTALACSIPPDILHEFRIDQTGTKINYSLSAWENLHPQIYKNFENSTKIPFTRENLGEILQKNIIENADFSLNNEPLTLRFLTGTIVDHPPKTDEDLFIPPTLITAEFEISQKIDFSKKNNLRLEFDKTSQIDISPLIHPFVVLSFQEWTAKYYVLNEHNRTFDVFDNNGTDFVVNNFLEESYYQNNFELIFEKLNENYTNPNDKTLIKNITNPLTESKNPDESVSILDTKKFLENFFTKEISLAMQILGIFLAIIAGGLHGLLPGHSKAILGTYILSAETARKKEIFTLILSTAFSHTIFIFLLAIVILALQKGLWATATIATKITAMIYIAFGIFFLWQFYKNFKAKNISTKRIQWQHHGENCDCEIHKNIFKKTFWTGIIAWANPCIDALLLFTIAISLSNAVYGIILIVAFSLGIGIILGILAFFLSRGKNFLNKKSENFVEKFQNYLTLLAGIFIIFSGIWYLIW